MSINNDTFFIEVYIFGGYYKVSDSSFSNHISNFFPGCPYYLTKEAKFGAQLTISLEINKNSREKFPFDNLTVIEYKDINHSIILESYDYPLYYSEDNNLKKMTKISYIKNRDTNLVAVKIIPNNYLILSMNVIMYFNYYYFDFEKNNTLYLSNIKKTQKYDYLILNLEGKKSQILNISLSMKHNCTINPFEYLYITESEYSFVGPYSTKIPHSIKMSDTKSKKVMYLITENETKYVTLRFDIKCDIEQFNITNTYNYVDNVPNSFYLKNGIWMNINELILRNRYYLYINSSNLKSFYVSFIVEDKINYFNYINIYEDFDKEKNTYKRMEDVSISFKNNSGEIGTNLTYSKKSIYTSTICLEIIPRTYIELLKVKIDCIGDTYMLEDGISSSYNSLLKDYKYYFSIEIKKRNKILVTLKLNRASIYSSFNLNIYEKSMQKSYYLNEKKQNCSFEMKEGYLTTEFYYDIFDSTSDTLLLELKPEINLDFINICIKFVEENENENSNPSSDNEDGHILIITISIVVGLIVIIAVIIVIFVIRKNRKMNSYYNYQAYHAYGNQVEMNANISQ